MRRIIPKWECKVVSEEAVFDEMDLGWKSQQADDRWWWDRSDLLCRIQAGHPGLVTCKVHWASGLSSQSRFGTLLL